MALLDPVGFSFFLTLWLTQSQRMDRLAQLSIEELISIKVVSAEKSERPLSESLTAVYVVTREDIEHSGGTQLAELLRFVPGLQTARVSLNIWAISIRGFNELHADKLLVLIDGRPIYNHLFSGVFWPMFEMSSDEIERIEVIRGPGSTLWGANAVNGIINIITRQAGDTQGLYVGLSHGDQETAGGDVRYGFKLGPSTQARLNLGFVERDQADVRFGPRLVSDEHMQDRRLGIRVDHQFNQNLRLLAKGDVFENLSRRPQAPNELDIDDRGHHIFLRLDQDTQSGLKRSAQFFVDSVSREGEFRWHVYDFDFKEQRTQGKHQWVWGLGFRQIDDHVTRGLAGGFTFMPERNTEKVGNLFVQDRLQLNAAWSFTFGLKWEHNDYTDSEFQPSLRLHYSPPSNPDLHLWAATSRAVHVPSRLERDALSQGLPGPPAPRVAGNPDLDSAFVTAYELGFRTRLGASWWLDTALFFNDYDRQVAFEESGRPGTLLRVNGMAGHTRGAELALEWRRYKWWRLAAATTFLDADLAVTAGERPRVPLAEFYEDQSPDRQFNLRNQWLPAPGFSVSAHWRYVGAVREAALANPARPPRVWVPSYNNLDLHAAWQISEAFSLEVAGRDLFGEHREIGFYQHEAQYHLELKFWF